MTTIQDRINKQIDKITFEMDCSEGESNVWNKKLKELFSESIKEVEEETRKEIINHIDFFADQSRWFVDEDNGVGPIIQTRVISVEDLQKELLSITNKEKQNV